MIKVRFFISFLNIIFNWKYFLTPILTVCVHVCMFEIPLISHSIIQGSVSMSFIFAVKQSLQHKPMELLFKVVFGRCNICLWGSLMTNIQNFVFFDHNLPFIMQLLICCLAEANPYHNTASTGCSAHKLHDDTTTLTCV